MTAPPMTRPQPLAGTPAVTGEPSAAATPPRPRPAREGVPGHTRRSLPLPTASRRALRRACGHPISDGPTAQGLVDRTRDTLAAPVGRPDEPRREQR
ncbi:hypothetical protein AB0I68_30365 [Streptomyces sp. NPDC050448]|uniref:hypothetical protein n=1 Tax=Streptomyces sp. NPDC050448 TaxID=3155404 RepID=UPI0034222E8A